MDPSPFPQPPPVPTPTGRPSLTEPAEAFDIDRNLETVLGGLRRLGVAAEKKGRNDLVYQGGRSAGRSGRGSGDGAVVVLKK